MAKQWDIINQKAGKLLESFKFIQMNFWDGRLAYPISHFLTRENPDIFSAQEMLSGGEKMLLGHLTAESLLKKGFFNEVALGGSRLRLSTGGIDFQTHCATFTRGQSRIKDKAIIPLHHNPHDSSQEEKDRVSYCSLLHTRVQLADGAVLHVLNHHAHLVIDGRMGSPIVDADFRLIAEYASARLFYPAISTCTRKHHHCSL